MITRRSFISVFPAVSLGTLALPALAQDKKPDPLAIDKVNQFVRFGHGDMAGTRQMLEEMPQLLNACYDWGNGDFETALGGASHMGRKDIAEYLVGKGARMDIFAAAMLNRVDIVRAMAVAYPALLTSKGPHGIPLLTHAQKGEAADVIEFLKSAPLK